MTYCLRPVGPDDRAFVSSALCERWGTELVVSRGQLWVPSQLPGFLARQDGKTVGLATFRDAGSALEVVTLDSFVEGRGIGTALLSAIAEEGRRLNKSHLWLLTTNDNIPAIRFYQRRGWDLVALHHGALVQSRKLKPQIPLLGHDDIPIDHELEFRLAL